MAENYVLLETLTLTETASSVTFDNLPTSGYSDLKVVGSFRGTTAQVYEITHIRFNGLTTNLLSRSIEGNGTSASSFSNTHIYFSSGVGTSATASTFANAVAYIPNYLSGDYKAVTIDNTGENAATLSYSQLTAGLWSSTAAITSIQLAPTANFVAGSTFSLYALAATGTTPTFGPSATGGDNIANDGTYWYHAFRSSGTFTPGKALTCDYLVVAGGGSGGYTGGGGGAGGFRAITGQSLTATGYTVTVGAGGAVGGYNPRVDGSNGTDSVFNSFTSTGGGRAATGNYVAATGGSGGGGSATGWGGGNVNGAAGNTPSTSPAQGFAGGTGGSGSNYVGGGGGGASAVGANSSGAVAGAGGAGANSYNSITITSWLTATSNGISGYLAGGGGGGGITAGAGGSGGGGAGAAGDANGTSGTANTGSGGGGSRVQTGNAGTGGSGGGGSGIVIIRYPMV